MRKTFIILTTILAFVACSDNCMLEKLEEIRSHGESDPICAMNRLDSLHPQLIRSNEYIYMKSLLLDMRLKDKANIPLKSNGAVEEIVKYFEENGTIRERQEAMYYAGNTYFNLNDIPKSLIYFQRAADVASSSKNCDSVLLRITYSKLETLSKKDSNQYRYYKDLEAEKLLIKKKEEYRNIVFIDSVVVVCMVFLFILILMYKKNRHLKEMVGMVSNIASLDEERNKLKNRTQKLQHEYDETLRLYEEARSRLGDVSAELNVAEQNLKQKEQLLDEKLAENKRIVAMLHKAELTEKAEDIMQTIFKASEGKCRMTAQEWQRLYSVVDDIQPDLMEKMVRNIGYITEQQQQVCYLLSMGLTNTQIENLTDIPHATVWRWRRKFSWI